MRRDTPSTCGSATLVIAAPLPGSQPRSSHIFIHDLGDLEKDIEDDCEYDIDISSLALGSIPFPFTAGFTMDSPAARRFSSSAEERVGLLGAAKVQQYGGVEETESLLRGEGVLEEVKTSASLEAKLLAKYSLPLMVTYLLQYSFSLVTLFVVGHIGTDELGAVSLATMTANITGMASSSTGGTTFKMLTYRRRSGCV
jgi:MATE family multidrug resistance protein